MTAKDPAKRPQTWSDVLKDLHQIKTGKSPLPPYPGEDESTILLNPRHRPNSRANTINLSAAAKKAITLSASHEALLGRQKRTSAAKAASSGGGFLRLLLFLLFLGGVLFAVWHFALKDNADFQALLSGTPRVAPSQVPAPIVGQPGRPIADAPAPETPAAETSAPEPPPLSAGTGTVTPGAWNHPGFIQAANLFNKTLEAYRAHLRKPDPAAPALSGLIADAQYAALLFETIRPDAPAAVPVTLYANQSYQLVNDLRRARLTPEAKKNLHSIAPKKRNETLAPFPTPEPDRTDPLAPRHMQFGYAWETLPAPVDRPETAEFVFLLSTVAEPSPDTRAQAGLPIHGPLRWLTPLDEACRALRVQPTPRVPVEGAPFPYGGFFQHTFPAGRFGGLGPGQPTYASIRLITDSEDRLVAVQLFAEDPAPPLNSSPMAFSSVSKIMDFVTGRSIPDKGDVRALHRTLRGEGTLRIDSEVADFTEGPDAKPIFRSVLLMPQGVANNLLYHLLGRRS